MFFEGIFDDNRKKTVDLNIILINGLFWKDNINRYL